MAPAERIELRYENINKRNVQMMTGVISLGGTDCVVGQRTHEVSQNILGSPAYTLTGLQRICTGTRE